MSIAKFPRSLRLKSPKTLQELDCVKAYIEAFGPVTKDQIREAMGMTQSTVDHRVDDLSATGQIQCKGRGPTSMWVIPGGRSERAWQKLAAEHEAAVRRAAKESKRLSAQRRRAQQEQAKEAADPDFERDSIRIISKDWQPIKLAPGAVRSVFDLAGA